MEPPIKIGSKKIGAAEPAYVIAEIGSNHNQDKNQALDMISQCAEGGADAVKFQSIRYDRLYNTDKDEIEFRNWFKQIELDETWYHELADYSSKAGVHFLSSPTYPEAIDLLERCEVLAYKLASPQVQGNLPLVKQVAEIGKPIFFSIGYSDYGDIVNVMNTFREAGNEHIIPLHCTSKYPTPADEVNLRFMNTLKAMTGRQVGFSDHTLGIHIPATAVALGACAIEKHVTLDPSADGPDHHFALPIPEFARMVSLIRETEEALGDGTRMRLLEEEQSLRKKVQLKAVTTSSIDASEQISDSSLIYTRANDEGITWTDRHLLKMCKSKQSIAKNTLLQWDMLSLTTE
jgi:sialic acid synthase SpsE